MYLNRTYLRQMRVYRRLAKWADRHEVLLNVASATEVSVFLLYIFMHY